MQIESQQSNKNRGPIQNYSVSYNNLQSKKNFNSSENYVNVSSNANQSANSDNMSNNPNNNFQMNPALSSFYNNLKYNKHNVRNSVKNTIHEYVNRNLSNDDVELQEDV